MTTTGPSWVFGYGSLIWKQDFPFIDSRPGYINGWARRFWQGSHDHRGVESDPGRVVTLVHAADEKCYGRAFLVEPAVFDHLDFREKNGYERLEIDIHFRQGPSRGTVYRAAENNPAYLGPAPLSEIRDQVLRCSGPSGSNREYVFELARALRELGISDPHVHDIEALIREVQGSCCSTH